MATGPISLVRQLSDGITFYKSTHTDKLARIVMSRETRDSLLTEVSCVEPEPGTEIEAFADVRVKIDSGLPKDVFILMSESELTNFELFKRLAAEGEIINEPSLS